MDATQQNQSDNVKLIAMTVSSILFIVFMILSIVFNNKAKAAKEAGNAELEKKHTKASLLYFIFVTLSMGAVCISLYVMFSK